MWEHLFKIKIKSWSRRFKYSARSCVISLEQNLDIYLKEKFSLSFILILWLKSSSEKTCVWGSGGQVYKEKLYKNINLIFPHMWSNILG